MIFTSEGLDSIWQQEIAVQVEVDVDSSAHVDASGLPICRLPFWTGIGQREASESRKQFRDVSGFLTSSAAASTKVYRASWMLRQQSSHRNRRGEFERRQGRDG